MLLEELLDGLLLHFSLGLAVDFVAHQDEGEFLWLLGRALGQKFGDP